MGIKNRENPRRAILWSGTIMSSELDQSCHIWDISLGGAVIKADKPLPEGTKVSLKTEKYGTLDSVISWAGESYLGVKFNNTPEKTDELFGEASLTLGLKNSDE